ncbi:MAG: polysaccharide biosynthesis tyrosine autokinase [Ktedonobacteraceae bacterium]
MKVLVRSLVRWSWLLVISIILGYIVGRVLTSAIPPTYQSTAYIQLNASTRGSQAQIIQSVSAYAPNLTADSVLVPVLKHYRQIDREYFVAKQLVITPTDQSSNIQVQVTFPNAKIAAGAANELSQGMVDQQNKIIKAAYDKQIQIVTARIASEQAGIDKLNMQYSQAAGVQTPNQAQLSLLHDSITSAQTTQNSDISAKQNLQTEEVLYGNPLTISQKAVVATKPSSLLGSIPFAPVMIVVFLILCLVTITFLEQGAGRVNEAYTLQQKVAVPVLGALRWATPLPLKALSESRSPYAEDCRVMMADVLFHAEEAKAKVIAVTGTRHRAGASLVAAELALLLAQSKRRVLLIDANLHEPSLHTLVNIPNEAGFALMLEEARKARISSPGASNGSVDIVDRIPVDNFIKPTPFPTLYMLPAGKAKINPSDLLSMPEVGQFLRWASSPVDFVVIDCPSLDRGDAHVLGALSDQTLIVVDATKDRIKQVINTKNDLTNTGVKLSGLIVNKLGRWI